MGGQVAGDPGVEVPAVIVELAGDGLDLGQALPLDLHEAEDDVHDLDAGVVDVVLDLDLLALVAQAAGERVAEAGVPQVADVGRLVGVDVRVLDDDLLFLGGEPGPAEAVEETAEIGRPVEEEIDEAGPGHLDAADALDACEERRRLLGDGARRPLELLRELEREGEGQVAHLPVGRRGHLEVLRGEGIGPGEPRVNLFFQTSFEIGHDSALL